MTGIISRIGAILLITPLWLAGCAEPVKEDDKAVPSALEGPVLRVGVTANYPPLIEKQNGKLAGIEIDLGNQVGKDLNKRMDYMDMPWEQLIPALVDGKIDVIMSGMSVTAGRKKKIAFTDSYLEIGQMAITRVTEVKRLGSLTALLNAPITVGFEADTTGEAFVKDNMHNAKPKAVASIDAAIVELRNGEIDAFVHDAPTAWRIGSDPAYSDLIGLYWPLTEEYLAWGVRLSDPALLKALNEQIAAMKKDGRLSQILRKWIKVRVEVK